MGNDACPADSCYTPQANYSLLVGRRDCLTAPNYPSSVLVGLPAPVLDAEGMVAFFQDEFGMDEGEMVAIMGAHTLGSMAEGSGYTGSWAEGVINEQFKVIHVNGLLRGKRSGIDFITAVWLKGDFPLMSILRERQ